MEEDGPIQTQEELLNHPSVQKARSVVLSICDVVHFRLVQVESVFQMAELHLLKRDPGKFSGFAEIRIAIENSMRGATIKDKIDACCTKHPDWVDARQILYSAELEVWMDMSYPNPWALELYHATLQAGKEISIPEIGPFSSTFHTLLKEKNGYELTQPSRKEEESVEVYIGEDTYPKEPHIHLLTPRIESRSLPYSTEVDLASQLAFGLMEKDLEEHSAKLTANDVYFPHALGYRLIGPTLLLLIQSLAGDARLVTFTGLGASFLNQLITSVKHHWSWLAEVTSARDIAELISVFPGTGEQKSLLPANSTGDANSLIQLDSEIPADLLHPAMKLFLEASFNGDKASRIQSGAAAFINDFAEITRGLHIPLASDPVIQSWCQYVLSPEEAFLDWASVPGHLPGFKRAVSFWQLKNAISNGPWPTASYLRAGDFSKWLALRTKSNIPEILDAQGRYA